MPLPSKTFVIAELSANHNNNFDLAVKTIESIAKTGADAVKVQTYRPESLTINVVNDFFQQSKSGLWKGYTPWKLFEEASMPYEWQPILKKVAEDNGLIFFSSPFDLEGVDFLAKLDCPIYKVASPEINDLPLIKHIAKQGKPIIISTGMASLSDIEAAINSCYALGNHDISLLKCTSEYPAPYEKANLLTIPNMKTTFGVRVGVSDHTLGCTIPIAAIALGATIIEKHYILDRSLGGPDSTFSMQPEEFKKMVEEIRNTELALGQIDYELQKDKVGQRRSLFFTKNMEIGEILTECNVRSVRGNGLIEPKEFSNILGKPLTKVVKKGDPVSWYDL